MSGDQVTVTTGDQVVVTLGGIPGVGFPIQPTAPTSDVPPIWLDTSTVPPVLKVWNGTAWVAIGGSSPSLNLLYGADVYGAGIYSPAD